MKYKADLHIHSNYSDGSDSIEELLKHITQNEIKIFALTDHDTINGCKEMLKRLIKISLIFQMRKMFN